MAALNFASESVWTGDNLAVMRGINSECIDLIYLDPPFNSNRAYEAPIGSKAAGASLKATATLQETLSPHVSDVTHFDRMPEKIKHGVIADGWDDAKSVDAPLRHAYRHEIADKGRGRRA